MEHINVKLFHDREGVGKLGVTQGNIDFFHDIDAGDQRRLPHVTCNVRRTWTMEKTLAQNFWQVSQGVQEMDAEYENAVT